MESMSGSVPLRSATSEAILREIRADIITRKLKPGQKLTEQSVCEKYGISRSPVRTIFQQLEKEGMVMMLGNGCKQIVPFERSDLLDLYDYRHYIETNAVKNIFESRRRYAPLIRLMELLDGKAQNGGIAEDIAFHRAVIEMSGNRYMINAYATIAPTLYTIFSINVPLYRQQFTDEYNSRHMTLVQSLMNDTLDVCLGKFDEHHDYALKKALVAMDMIEKGSVSEEK